MRYFFAGSLLICEPLFKKSFSMLSHSAADNPAAIRPSSAANTMPLRTLHCDYVLSKMPSDIALGLSSIRMDRRSSLFPCEIWIICRLFYDCFQPSLQAKKTLLCGQPFNTSINDIFLFGNHDSFNDRFDRLFRKAALFFRNGSIQRPLFNTGRGWNFRLRHLYFSFCAIRENTEEGRGIFS